MWYRKLYTSTTSEAWRVPHGLRISVFFVRVFRLNYILIGTKQVPKFLQWFFVHQQRKRSICITEA